MASLSGPPPQAAGSRAAAVAHDPFPALVWAGRLLCDMESTPDAPTVTEEEARSLLAAKHPRAIYQSHKVHRAGEWPTTYLQALGRKGNLILRQKRQWLCRSGSFLRGYVPNTDSYVVGRLYRPNDLGVIRGEIDVRRDRTEGGDSLAKDIHFWS